MTTINVKCVDNNLIMISTPVVASGSVNAVEIAFEFCSSWDDYGKTAMFYREKAIGESKTNEIYNVVINDNKCIVPNEVLEEKGFFCFGVYGINADGVVKTSNRFKYKIVEGSYLRGETPSEPTEDMYTQLLGAYGHNETRVEQVEKGITALEETINEMNENFVDSFEGVTTDLKNLKYGIHNITCDFKVEGRYETYNKLGFSIFKADRNELNNTAVIEYLRTRLQIALEKATSESYKELIRATGFVNIGETTYSITGLEIWAVSVGALGSGEVETELRLRLSDNSCDKIVDITSISNVIDTIESIY